MSTPIQLYVFQLQLLPMHPFTLLYRTGVLRYSAPDKGQNIATSMSACLYAYLWNRTSESRELFCASYIRGRSSLIQHCDTMYFRFCG